MLHKRCPRCNAASEITAPACPCGHQFRTRYDAQGNVLPPELPTQVYPQPFVAPAPTPEPRKKIEICSRLAFPLALLALWLGNALLGIPAFILASIGNARIHNNPEYGGRWEAIIAGVCAAIGIWRDFQGF